MGFSRAAVVVAAALLVAGCGGGSGGDDKSAAPDAAAPAPTAGAEPPPAVSGGGAPPSAAKKRYIKKADRICVSARARLVPIRSKLQVASKGTDPNVVFRRYAALSAQAAGVYGNTLGQIRALDEPPADQAQIDRLNALLGQTAGLQRELSAAALAHDAPRIKQLSVEASAVAERYRSAAKAYGLRECGSAAGAAFNRRGNR